jgi:hypothetical protein
MTLAQGMVFELYTLVELMKNRTHFSLTTDTFGYLFCHRQTYQIKATVRLALLEQVDSPCQHPSRWKLTILVPMCMPPERRTAGTVRHCGSLHHATGSLPSQSSTNRNL